jgi:Family of unknown function (DUF5677)
MSIAHEGFLSPEVAEWTQMLRSKNTKWFSLAERLSKFGLKMLGQACPSVQSELNVFSLALFARCLSNFQAVILLIERGLIVEAISITRVCLEGFIFLAVLSEEKEDFIEKMRKNELDANHKMIAGLLESSSAKEFDEKIRMRFSDALTAINKAGRKKHVGLDQLANRVGINDIYSIYRRLSRDAHTTIFSIERYRNKLSADHTEISFDPGIAENEVSDTLQNACCVFIGAVVALSNLIDRQLQTDAFQAILGEYDALMLRKAEVTLAQDEPHRRQPEE